jgi:addiction module RelE/StbE family toxin
MIEVVWDEGFRRRYKKRIGRSFQLKERFWQKLGLFVSDPFSRQLRTHKLSGKLQGLWAFSIDDDYRIVFEFVAENRALLIDVGTHDEVY